MAFFSSVKTRKIISAILILAFLLPSFFLLPAKKAEAIPGVPVGDWLSVAFHTITSASTFLTQGKEWGLDSIAWMLANVVLQQITADMVDWINSGFEGNPGFIDQPEYFFLDLGDQVVGDFIFKNEDLRFLCDPLGMGIDIRGALSIAHFGFSTFRYRSSCRLSQIFSNIQNARFFIRGSFKRGGWTGWHTLTQIRGNNIFGSYNLAFEEMLKRNATKKSGERNILNWGNGFFPTRNQEGFTKTPGAFIETQLSNAFGANLSRVGLADELNEIISALIGQLLQKTLQGGLLSLSVSASTNNNPYSSRLRNGDPAAPFRRLTTEERSGFKALSDKDASESQEAFDQFFSQADTAGINRLGIGTSVPNPKASLDNAFTHQSFTCTDQYGGGSGSAGLAIDNSVSTYSKTGCVDNQIGSDAPNPKINAWWEVILNNQTTVDEIRIEALSTQQGLGNINCANCDLNPTACGFSSGIGICASITSSDGDANGAAYMEAELIDTLGNTQISYFPLNTPNPPIQYPGKQFYVVDKAQLIFNPPVQIKRARVVAAGSDKSGDDWRGGVNLREVTLYQHLAPVFDLAAFPTTVSAFDALIWQPLNPDWVKVYYFPRWDVNPVPLLSDQSTDSTATNYNPNVPASVMVGGSLIPYDANNWRDYVEVWIRDSNGQYCANQPNLPVNANPTASTYCIYNAAGRTYQLEPGYSFSVIFVATEPREDLAVFKSSPTIKQFTVPALQINQ